MEVLFTNLGEWLSGHIGLKIWILKILNFNLIDSFCPVLWIYIACYFSFSKIHLSPDKFLTQFVTWLHGMLWNERLRRQGKPHTWDGWADFRDWDVTMSRLVSKEGLGKFKWDMKDKAYTNRFWNLMNSQLTGGKVVSTWRPCRYSSS